MDSSEGGSPAGAAGWAKAKPERPLAQALAENGNTGGPEEPLGRPHFPEGVTSPPLGLSTVAIGLLAYDLAGEKAGAVLDTALAIKMIAYVGIPPVASAFAERLPRRGFLIALDLVRSATMLLLPFVDQVWQIYVLIFALQSASASFTPAFQATIPDILPDEAARSLTTPLAKDAIKPGD
jgi:hypothetical protein